MSLLTSTRKCRLTDDYFRCIVPLYIIVVPPSQRQLPAGVFAFWERHVRQSPYLCSCRRAALPLLWPPRKSRGINTCRTRRNRRILNDLSQFLSSLDATLTKNEGGPVCRTSLVPMPSDLRLSTVRCELSASPATGPDNTSTCHSERSEESAFRTLSE
jgi:hypothetical protein